MARWARAQNGTPAPVADAKAELYLKQRRRLTTSKAMMWISPNKFLVPCGSVDLLFVPGFISNIETLWHSPPQREAVEILD
jgi:hypothetical protein